MIIWFLIYDLDDDHTMLPAMTYDMSTKLIVEKLNPVSTKR